MAMPLAGRCAANGGADQGGPDVADIIEWLTSDACHALDDAGLLAGLGERLLAVGLPLARVTLHLRTLHPELVGRTLAWAPGEAVEVLDRQNGIENAAMFAESPVRHVMDSGEPMMVRLDRGADDQSLIEVFRNRDLVELAIRPLHWNDRPDGAVVFGTGRRSGFTTLEQLQLDRIVPTLRTVCELRLLRLTEAVLLDTYVGSATGHRILTGHIKRNDVEVLETALLLCDLRDFTSLSNRLPGARVLQLLNAYFDRVIPAIVDGGGEILKFMGDAVLAFFHCLTPSASCAAALEAAQRALDRLNCLTSPDAQLRAGIALHYGAVSYGNIGSGGRLDFTLIGPDVNLVSRIQTACALSGKSLLMSGRFAGLLDRSQTGSVGRYELKGFDEPAELFTPTDATARPT